jgi:hypothetical protein
MAAALGQRGCLQPYAALQSSGRGISDYTAPICMNGILVQITIGVHAISIERQGRKYKRKQNK